MKLQRYLNEKYVASMKHGNGGGYGGMTDVFANPSKKEIKEVESQSFDGYGFRFIIDFQENIVYMWSNRIIHKWMVAKNPKLFPDLKWDEYFMHHKQVDRYFSGHLDSGQIVSDVWNAFARRSPSMTDEDKKPFIAMHKHDKKWLLKYNIEPRQIQKIVNTVVK